MIQPDITILIQMVIFILAIWIINREIFVPLMKVFEERRRRTDGFKEEAKQLKVGSSKIKEEYSEKIKRANVKANETKRILREEGKREEENIIKTAQEKAAKSIKEIKEIIEKEKKGAKEKLLEQTKVFGREIAEKLLSRKLS